MKKYFLNIILTLTLVLAAIPVFADTIKYKFVPVNDPKTKIEFARAAVPTDFSVTSDVTWERNVENPAQIVVTAKNEDDDVMFFFSSEKSYVDVNSDKQAKLNSGKEDIILRVFKKKFQTPENYVFEIVNTTNPNAQNIKLVSEKTCSDELSDYLIREMYGKISKIESKAKTDKRSTKIRITNPYIKPYIATYSFDMNGKKYKQTFVTMFTSLDFEYAIKNSDGESDTAIKKLWKNAGFYTFRSVESKYDKYFDDFLVFISDSMFNQKTLEALDGVKMQMIAELSPSYRDPRTGSRLRNMPSDLFRRYFEVGLPDYSYIDSMIKPTLSQVRWLVNVIVPQSEFSYRKINQVWRQKFYVPQKFEYVYMNKTDGSWVISTENQNLKKGWITLKPNHLK